MTTQQEIATACQTQHQNRQIRTAHGLLCVECYAAYRAAKPKARRQKRARVTAYGDFAIFAAVNRRLNG